MNLTPASELVDEVWGKVGTPERDKMEAQLKKDLLIRQCQNDKGKRINRLKSVLLFFFSVLNF